MKRLLILFIVLHLMSSLIFISCEKDQEESNTPPTCTITSPSSGSEIEKGETVTISVEAEDEDDNLKEVLFYVEGSGVGSASSFPYNFEWDTSEEEPGWFTIKAKAIDEAKEKTTDEINIILKSNSAGTITDIDGNEYFTVQIGDQEWMAENLRTTTYNDGSPIELVENDSDWDNTNIGAYCWYDNDGAQYAKTYGALYNWYAVNNGNLCPEGWHVPTDEEWKTLEMELGMSQTEADDNGSIEYRGTNQGSKMAGNAGLWTDGSLVSDSEFGTSIFSAFPGGSRSLDGEFDNLGRSGIWWSATDSDTYNAYYRKLYYDDSGVSRFIVGKSHGSSVRCVRDNVRTED